MNDLIEANARTTLQLLEAGMEIERLRRENVAVSVHCSMLIETLLERGATQEELSEIAQLVRDNQQVAGTGNAKD